jgi:hypothetical protein
MKLEIIELYFIMIKIKNLLLRNLFLKFMMQRKYVWVIYHLLFHIDYINLLVKTFFLINTLWKLVCFCIVNTEEAGDGSLSVKIKQNGSRITHEQIRVVPHIYEISFIPETSDDCTVSISFNGENSRKLIYSFI